MQKKKKKMWKIFGNYMVQLLTGSQTLIIFFPIVQKNNSYFSVKVQT